MRKNIIWTIGGAFCAGMLLLASCTKMDHYYKDYVIERTYIGRPDSIWVQPGDQRVQIGWLKPKDPASRDLVIRWNGTDSVVLAIDPDAERQSIIIENLEERDYVFDAYTTDGLGNRSVPMELSTPVYGDAYRSGMRDMSLSYSVTFPDSIALMWSAFQPDDLQGVNIEFTDNAGERQQVFVPATTTMAMLYEVDRDMPISLTSSYLPHENAFEYMYTESTELDLVATRRNTLTFSSTTYTDAVYIDFKWVRGFLEAEVPQPVATDIDMCYALGAGSRSNLFTIDGTGFSAFATAWQNTINAWPVRNYARLKLDRTEGVVALYDSLDEMDRSQMAAAYDNSEAAAQNRLSGALGPPATVLRPDDIIFLHSADRGIYVAMKVLATPPAVSGALGDFVIEFKVSRP